jgi:hypothetical protein
MTNWHCARGRTSSRLRLINFITNLKKLFYLHIKVGHFYALKSVGRPELATENRDEKENYVGVTYTYC